MFFEVAIFTAAIWLSGVLGGKNAQAANQIALNLSSMTFMFGMGLGGVAAMIRVGNQKGLKNYRELKRIGGESIFFLTFLLEIVFAILFLLGRNWFPSLYLDVDDVVNMADNSEVIMLAAELLLVAAIFQISDGGVQVVVLGALRGGMQDVKIPTLITFIAYWGGIGFPVSFYLGLHTELKSTGIWLGLLTGLTASGIMLYLRFNYLTNKLIAKSGPNTLV